MNLQLSMRTTGYPRVRVQGFKHLVLAIILAITAGNGAVVCGQETLPNPNDCPPFNDKTILEISTDIEPAHEGERPPDCSDPNAIGYSALDLEPTGSLGKPYHYGAHFFHRPLYFEDPALERYGVSHGCVQPIISGVKFYGSALLLPVKMLRLPPHSCVPTPPCM